MKKSDLTGQQFGLLTVIEEAEKKSGQVAWKCRCSCEAGREIVALASNLRAGSTKSCGCLAGRHKDLAGQKFGRLTVVERVRVNGKPRWRCCCECGNPGNVFLTAASLQKGKTKSCGCLSGDVLRARSRTHGMSKTRTYNIWVGIRARCSYPKHIAYKDYGERGIRVCERWAQSFEDFLADMGVAPDGMELERDDPDGDYCPENCRWVPGSEQTNNRRNTVYLTHGGKTLSLRDWSRTTGISYATLRMRIKHGWDVAEALTTPPGKGKPRKRGGPSPQNKARHQLNNALKRGRLVKPPTCEHPGCENTELDAHHHKGYEAGNELDVVWLCREHHPLPHEKTLTWRGRTMTLRQWSQETGVPRATLYNRLVYRKWVPDESVFAPPGANQQRLLTHDGVTLCVKDWAERLGIGERTLAARLKKDLPLEEALRPAWRRTVPQEPQTSVETHPEPPTLAV